MDRSKQIALLVAEDISMAFRRTQELECGFQDDDEGRTKFVLSECGKCRLREVRGQSCRYNRPLAFRLTLLTQLIIAVSSP